MPWRFAVVLLIVLLALSERPISFASRLVAGGQMSVRQEGFENDNNLVDTMFQNFNGNESSDGGHAKKETIGPLPAPVSAPAGQPTATDTIARARAGRETVVFLTGSRVAIRLPSALATDLEIAIKIVPSPKDAAPPGPVVGDLVFEITADDPGDAVLTKLPLEVNLSARYTDRELGTLSESKLVLGWLDPASNTWKAAPKPAADANNNFLSATVQDLGTYAVYQAP